MGDDGPGSTVHLLCLAASSGVPLFCRSSSGGAPSRQQLPFSVIGSLNGVHMFGQNLDVQLNSARTEDTTVVWKNFHDSITLIALSSEEGTSELKLERMLHMVFGAMVLIVGLEELTNIRNVERLKKELRASYCLIDSFLGNSELIGDLTQCVDCVIPPEGSVMQVPHRLLTLTLLRGLELCLLCGPRPPLGELDPQLLERWWQPLLEPLRACLPLGPRALPDGFPLHSDILGLLLLHLELRRCLFTVEPSKDKEPGPAEKQEDTVHPAQTPRACYLVLGPGMGWQLVAVQLGLRLLLLMLSPQTPTHGLRSLATHTLQALTPLL
ncbi:protein fuzzy homolog isoform 3 [Rattus norvegicus]|uniref:protein fuzzy homolog isoform 3 n=1 Tax=Rattus norvegicus TaxID=10116 RepID=UPI0019173A8E|nr:protein fuzzy homolog isoform 3 [Rattus norvegicus]